MLLSTATSFAQRKAYADIWLAEWPLTISKYYICADFGNSFEESVCDENRPTWCKKFNSPMDGLNFLASLGWRVVSTFRANTPFSKQSVIHYLMEKDINDKSDIMKGITTKPEKKKEKKNYGHGKDGDDMY